MGVVGLNLLPFAIMGMVPEMRPMKLQRWQMVATIVRKFANDSHSLLTPPTRQFVPVVLSAVRLFGRAG